MKQAPTWWLLFAIFPLSVGLLWLDRQLTLQPQGHQFLEMTIVLLSFGLMALWVRGNQTPLANESATKIATWILPDPDCGQESDAPRIANRRNPQPAESAGAMLIDFKGKYN